MNNLATELYSLIFRLLSLKDIKNISLTCTNFRDIIDRFDWDIYCKYHNPLIISQEINYNFMKTQGRYLININDKNIIDGWLKFYPCIEEIKKYLSCGCQKIYFQIVNSNDSPTQIEIFDNKNCGNLVHYTVDGDIFYTNSSNINDINTYLIHMLLKNYYNIFSLWINDIHIFTIC